MDTYTPERHVNAARICDIHMHGSTWLVEIDGEAAEGPTYCDDHISDPGQPAVVWVSKVNVKGTWWDRSILREEFAEQLDAHLRAAFEAEAAAALEPA